ncbi:hypothetical protein QBC34DRAFT_410203 [Podospora aff. communis PSN243]|uniref:Uncharacterized protein n=1 Tax=Podospora aff. communis PSN243 TaxID=3040156 RepID=A0AAV9GFN1_9PEZI|nr:hypothetical protein QBC34DRAFT_410203 [Podospora aff. communis PSN243]
MLASDLERPFGQSTGRGFSLTRFKIEISYRTLIMQQQDLLALYIGPGHIVTPKTLYEIGHVITNADPICGHLRWTDEYSYLIPQTASFSFDQHLTKQETRQISEFSLPITAFDGQTTQLPAAGLPHIHDRLRCAVFHGLPCRCPASVHFNAIRSCPRCHTDFTVSIVPDDRLGAGPEARFLALPTWKFLGDNYKSGSFWASHAKPASSKRVYGPAFMYGRFNPDGMDHNTYHPEDDDIQGRVALIRLARREQEVPPQYTAVDTGALSLAKTSSYDSTGSWETE